MNSTQIPWKGMVITDLDRTLYSDAHTISPENLRMLALLKEHGYMRVLATGRSPYSLESVPHVHTAMDYLIFSSGAGILRCRDGKLLFPRGLRIDQALPVIKTLKSEDVDFMLHAAVPGNHHFYYFSTLRRNPDFERRLELYKEFGQPLDDDPEQLAIRLHGREFCQFVAIAPPGKALGPLMRRQHPDLSIILSTSPLDHVTHWIEVFPSGVNKGSAAANLARMHGIDRSRTLGIGNDYNDVKLLDWTASSAMVANAPEELKEKYGETRSNNDDGFAAAVRGWLDKELTVRPA